MELLQIERLQDCKPGIIEKKLVLKIPVILRKIKET